jgi:hypothetical protein
MIRFFLNHQINVTNFLFLVIIKGFFISFYNGHESNQTRTRTRVGLVLHPNCEINKKQKKKKKKHGMCKMKNQQDFIARTK